MSGEAREVDGAGVGARHALRWNFAWIALTGALYEFGSAFADTAVIAALVVRLTASAVAVGAAEAIARFGWLLPQLAAAHYAQRLRYRKPIYLAGGWGRAAALGLLALVLVAASDVHGSSGTLLVVFFGLWTVYSFVAGLAGVPYNDIVGRTVPSARRSRLLAGRVFLGGVLGVGAGLAIRAALSGSASLARYGLVLGAGAAVLALSTLCFALVREPPAPAAPRRPPFLGFLRDGVRVVRGDARVRLFVTAQLLTGLTTMAVPFYVLAARASGVAEAEVGTFVAAQTAGALALNPLWGWWGDRRGKLSLLRGVTVTSAASPLLALGLAADLGPGLLLPGYLLVFFLNGAAASGRVIADLGYLMEISPDARRPEYTGYTNVLVAPSRLLPLAAGFLVDFLSFTALFALAAGAVAVRLAVLARLDRVQAGAADHEGK